MRRVRWLRIVITATLVILIVWRVPTTALRQAFADLQGHSLWPAFACALAMLAVRWIKWHQLLATVGSKDLPSHAGRSLFGGFALGVVAPGRLGEVGRCLFVPEQDRAPVLLVNILDRALDLWALITCAVASLFCLIPRPAALFAVGVWMACLPFLIGLPRLVSKLGGLAWWPEKWRTRLVAAGEPLARIRSGRFAALALLSTMLDLLVLFFALRGFQRVDFAVALATFPWLVMAGGLPISFSGLGAREGTAVLLLASYGIPAAAAVEAALVLFFLSALLPALIGFAWLLAGRSWHSSLATRDLESLLVPLQLDSRRVPPGLHVGQ